MVAATSDEVGVKKMEINAQNKQQVAEKDNANVNKNESSHKKKKRNRKKNAVKTLEEDYPENIFPKGTYVVNKSIMLSIPNEEEMDEKDKQYTETLNSLRKAGECLKRIKTIVDKKFIVNVNLSDLCNEIENATSAIIKESSNITGMSGPVTFSKNECAAFHTPQIGENLIFEKGDVVKFDFGVQDQGHIVEMAQTSISNPIYEPLKQATIEATNVALKLSGPDALISDISAQIEEIITSFEVVEKNGNVLPVKPVKNLYGYQCESYLTDTGKSIPLIKGGGSKGSRMAAGDLLCIDTFATTGNGTVLEKGNGVVYSTHPHQLQYYHPLKKARNLMSIIRKRFDLLKFCPRTLLARCPSDINEGTLDSILNILLSSEKPTLKKYLPLYDKPGSMVSQCKHTIFIRNDFSEVFTL